jgi:hypothetical protein
MALTMKITVVWGMTPGSVVVATVTSANPADFLLLYSEDMEPG